jgi:putative ABC transport system permease protein
VLRLVLGQGLSTCAIGIVVGLAGALATTRLLSSLLYQITPQDPMTLGVVAILLMGVAAVACLLPALRATRINPVSALRSD